MANTKPFIKKMAGLPKDKPLVSPVFFDLKRKGGDCIFDSALIFKKQELNKRSFDFKMIKNLYWGVYDKTSV